MVPRGLFAIIGFGLAATAAAAPVRGSVVLPPEPRIIEHDAHWRVENGVLAVGPRQPDPRTDVVVVLEGPVNAKTQVPNGATSLHGLRLDPRVVVTPVGGSVDFKNDDRVPHTLYLEHAATLMPPTPTPAGQTRTQKFFASGDYRIRDEEYPHIEGTVLVLQSPYFARLDDKGNFRLDVPEGKYTLKVFWRDKWVVKQPLEVSGRSTEVTIQVPAPAATTPQPTAAATGAKP